MYTTPRPQLSRRRLLRRGLALSAGVLGTVAMAGVRGVSAQSESPQLALPEWPIPQGGSFVVIVTGADVTEVSATFAGRRMLGVREGGGFLVFFGTGQRIGETVLHAPLRYPVQADATLSDGRVRVLLGDVAVAPGEFSVEEIWLDETTSQLLDPSIVAREIGILHEITATTTGRRLWDGFFLRPTTGPITDVFGSRRSYNGGPAVGSHSGVDFGAATGTAVVAAAAGRVAHAGTLPTRGGAVYIDHGAGVYSGYCHLSRVGVRAGQMVPAGEVIGQVGATGLVTGPHLHWEVIVGGYQVDGLGWLVDPT